MSAQEKRRRTAYLVLIGANPEPVANIVGVDDEEEDDGLVQLADGVAKDEGKRQHNRREQQPDFLDVHLQKHWDIGMLPEHIMSKVCILKTLWEPRGSILQAQGLSLDSREGEQLTL